jgi:hypothetical protein
MALIPRSLRCRDSVCFLRDFCRDGWGSPHATLDPKPPLFNDWILGTASPTGWNRGEYPTMLRTALSIAFTALLAVGAFTAAQAPSGAKLTNDLLPPCMNESIRDAQQCLRLQGVTQKDGPFDVTFGPGQPAMPGETTYHAYLHDARHEGVHAICKYLMPGNRRLGCAVAFLHNGDEYKIHSATVSNDTNLGLMRCGALRLTQIVWPDVRPFDDLCPSASP